ncbi:MULTISPECIES: phosphoribosylanthranilate isomerase [unclassified Paenibacillus]|uniref:phosphoribosylanthranilate isomerase n=1 Tax=unclassified Paenibacillus TaxID=185978 RepID=UPI001AEA7021|nr:MULTISPECIES: phosphoribosylanthranilate isomerase [unclassified Paenibacillus]MBP1155272.1 phosphoribosylanthranilate isomerase [Paenibacillus sp. PvP091]MBP1169344.1 phosphoribosylanthranilate isomerase [Paenibacillus sp. PvR098]MBP2440372.1 phosphoribosylanthranilate isomerase [Paenibacillus sp. PvP052]
MVSVKICGLQTEEMAEKVAGLPVDYVGFVFARSKRQVTPSQAGAMLRRLQSGGHRPQAVGVFVNPSLDELGDVLREAALDVVQLHGQESPEFCLSVKNSFPEIQVFKVHTVSASMPTANTAESVRDRLVPYRGTVDGMLLDTFDPVYGGGSGKTFAWEMIPPYQEWCREAAIPLLVAGGLQPDNVRGLIDEYAPDGVDVSSGVETDGVKDIGKITTFVERVKANV